MAPGRRARGPGPPIDGGVSVEPSSFCGIRHFGDDRYATAVVAAVNLNQEQRSLSSTAVLVAIDNR